MSRVVVPLPLPASTRRGGRDDALQGCGGCGCDRFRAVVTVTTSGRVEAVEPLLVCDACGAAHVLRRGA